jgi:hypothetical protein
MPYSVQKLNQHLSCRIDAEQSRLEPLTEPVSVLGSGRCPRIG